MKNESNPPAGCAAVFNGEELRWVDDAGNDHGPYRPQAIATPALDEFLAQERKRKRSKKLVWVTHAQFQAVVTRKDAKLVISVTPSPSDDQYLVIALETGANVSNIDEVFENHSHKQLGPFDSIELAFREASKYARDWRKQKAAADRCTCEEIK